MNDGLFSNLEVNERRSTIQAKNYGFSRQRVALIDQEFERRRLSKQDQRYRSMHITK